MENIDSEQVQALWTVLVGHYTSMHADQNTFWKVKKGGLDKKAVTIFKLLHLFYLMFYTVSAENITLTTLTGMPQLVIPSNYFNTFHN